MRPAVLLNTHITDTLALKTLSVDDLAALHPLFSSLATGEGLTVEEAYERIGLVRAAVTLRAQGLAALPWIVTTRRGTPIAVQEDALRALVRDIEIDLCLYGAAYILRDPSDALGLRRLHPRTITLEHDPARGLVAITRRIGERTMRLTPVQDVLWVWEPSARSEVGPGPGLIATALTEARHVLAAQQYQAAYFERGALRPTVWMFQTRPTDAERSRLEQWLRQVLGGLRNAFRHVALSQQVQTVTLGDKLTDVLHPDLVQRAAEMLLVSFGVPQSLIFASAANYATAQRDYKTFVLLTLLPRARAIAAALAKHYAASNLILRIDETRIDAVQEEELAKAEAIQRLTGQPVMTLGEARERLDLPPLAARDEEYALLRLQQQLRVLAQAVEAGVAQEIAQTLVALPTPQPQPQPPATPPAGETEATRSVEVKQVYDADEEALLPHERELYRALRAALRALEQDIIRVLTEQQAPVTPELVRLHLLPALRTRLLQIAFETALGTADALRITMDILDLSPELLAWEMEHTQQLVDEQLAPMTIRYIEQVVAEWRATPNAGREELVELIKPVVSARRAETIAITAATEAQTAGVRAMQRYMRETYQLDYDMIWETANDERVCPICGALHGKPETEWGGRAGPPAHPRCRCGVRLRRRAP